MARHTPTKPPSPRDCSGLAKVWHASVPMKPALARIGQRLHPATPRAFGLSSELVAGVVVGAGLGWLADRWLGIAPWGLIVFVLLGFTAGVLNVMRSAGVVAGGGIEDGLRKDREG